MLKVENHENTYHYVSFVSIFSTFFKIYVHQLVLHYHSYAFVSIFSHGRQNRESTQSLDQMAAHIPCPDLPHACLHALPRFHAHDLNIPQGGEQKILLVQMKTYWRRTNASTTVCTGMLPSTLITNHPRKLGPRPFWTDPAFASTVFCPWRSGWNASIGFLNHCCNLFWRTHVPTVLVEFRERVKHLFVSLDHEGTRAVATCS